MQYYHVTDTGPLLIPCYAYALYIGASCGKKANTDGDVTLAVMSSYGVDVDIMVNLGLDYRHNSTNKDGNLC